MRLRTVLPTLIATSIAVYLVASATWWFAFADPIHLRRYDHGRCWVELDPSARRSAPVRYRVGQVAAPAIHLLGLDHRSAAPAEVADFVSAIDAVRRQHAAEAVSGVFDGATMLLGSADDRTTWIASRDPTSGAWHVEDWSSPDDR